MSLLTLMNRVCAQASLPQYTAFYSTLSLNTTEAQTAKELLVHAHEAGEEITRRAEWSNLYEGDSIAAGSTTYTIPSSFQRLVQGNSLYLTTPFAPITPVKSFDAWTVMSRVPSSQIYYFINQGSIDFTSPLTSTAAIQYITKNWIMNGSNAVSEFVADTDTTLFSEPLLALGILWRYKRAKGLDYADLQSEFEAELAREIAADRGLS